MSDQTIAALCTPQTFVRNTIFSDTFRANIVLDGVMTLVDIERYQVPFTRAREQMLKEKYGMTEQDIKDFYAYFSHSLRNGIKITNRLHRDPDFEEKSGFSLVSYMFQKTIKTADGYEVYLLSKPMTRFLQSSFCLNGKLSFLNLLHLGVRLSLVLNNFSRFGVHIGVVDLDALCIEKVPQETGAKDIIKFSTIIYARSKDDDVIFPYPSVLPPTAHPSLLTGGQPTETTDLYSLAAVLTTLANGTYGSENPALYLDSDIYPTEFQNALNGAIRGELNLKTFNKMLRNAQREYSFMVDKTSPIEVPLALYDVDYLDQDEDPKPEPEQDAEEPEYAGPDDEAVDQTEPDLEDVLDGEFDIEPEYPDASFIVPEEYL